MFTMKSFPEMVDEAKKRLKTEVTFSDLGKIFLTCSVVLYPVLAPNFAAGKKNTKTMVRSLLHGEGLTVPEFFFFVVAYTWMLFEYSVLSSWICLAAAVFLFSWICPFKDLGIAIQQLGKGMVILQNVREQAHNILPYHKDLLPLTPKLLPHTAKLLLNIEVLGPAMPQLMSEKKYILPVMPELCEKIDTLVPIMDVLLPNIHKVAPSVKLLLPKLEILAPHVEGLMPLWDDLEPRLPILLDEIDNLAPYLGETVPYMDRLIPMLDLLPMIHEAGVLKYEIACKALPTVVRCLPKAEVGGLQQRFLSTFSSSLARAHIKGQEMLKNQEQKLLEWRKVG